jgi:hypothetical protein
MRPTSPQNRLPSRLDPQPPMSVVRPAYTVQNDGVTHQTRHPARLRERTPPIRPNRPLPRWRRVVGRMANNTARKQREGGWSLLGGLLGRSAPPRHNANSHQACRHQRERRRLRSRGSCKIKHIRSIITQARTCNHVAHIVHCVDAGNPSLQVGLFVRVRARAFRIDCGIGFR